LFARLKQRIDQAAIDMAAKSLPPGLADPVKTRIAAEIMAQPDFLTPSDKMARLALGDKNSFRFDSLTPCANSRNDIVHGRIFKAGDAWATRPFVILIHGWNAELHYLYGLPFVARALNRRKINAALIELPFHLHRRPLEQDCMRDFISDDVPGMLGATRQAIADIHSLGLWARAQGCPSIGVWGFSLGAWLAGLYICHSDLPKAAVLTTPVSNLERGVSELSFCHPIRSSLDGASLDLSRLNLTSHRPKCAAVQLVQSEYDLFVPPETYRDLARAWNLPGWEIQPHGHITILASPKATRKSIQFFQDKLS
jgi:pimeloyl-ACP methyl ester carboxylesterase